MSFTRLARVLLGGEGGGCLLWLRESLLLQNLILKNKFLGKRPVCKHREALGRQQPRVALPGGCACSPWPQRSRCGCEAAAAAVRGCDAVASSIPCVPCYQLSTVLGQLLALPMPEPPALGLRKGRTVIVLLGSTFLETVLVFFPQPHWPVQDSY